MRHIIYSLIAILLSTLGMAQNNNYNQNKSIKTLVYSPQLISNQLSEKVNEQSGLVWHDDLFWIINDSDCAPELIAYTPKGKLQKVVTISNTNNRDWEDLAEDDTYIYIGDFGNNSGVRTDLRVLRLLKSEITDKKEIQVDFITFSWADQKDFSSRNMQHNFDCEAFFAYGDSLYFFTKNWDDKKTRLYSMPKLPGDYKLKPLCEFDVDFMVTAADITTDGKTVALVGYKNFHTYMMLLSDFEGQDFFGGKALRLDLNALGGSQTEGLVFTDKNELYISCEESITPQAIYKVDWEKILRMKQ